MPTGEDELSSGKEEEEEDESSRRLRGASST